MAAISRDHILEALDKMKLSPSHSTVTGVTRLIYGPSWTMDDAKAVGRMVGDMVREGSIRWSGIHIYRKGV